MENPNAVDMVAKLAAYFKSKIKIYPCNSNRASGIGHPCERFHVLNWTSWDKVTPHNEGLQAIFDDGHMHEKQMVIDLQNAGVEIFQQQIPLGEETTFRKLNITGHLDWKIQEGKLAPPVEMKTMNCFVFDYIHTIDDMLNHERHYIRSYVAQFSTYLLMTNNEFGYFLLKNKNNAEIKQIRLDLDYEYAEQQLQKIKRVNQHVVDKTLPDCIKYDESICGGCRHRVTCNPEVPENLSLHFMEDPAFNEMVCLAQDNKLAASIYAKNDKKVKEVLKETGKLKIVAGISGPPEFPGLIEASVWIKLS